MSRCRSTSNLLILKVSNSGTADLLFEVNTKYSTQPGHLGLASVLLLWHLCNIDCCIRSVTGSRVTLLIEHQAQDRKVASLNPGSSGRRIFFSRVNLV